MNTAEQLRNPLWDAREAASFLKVSAFLDLRACRARRDAVHSRRRADPVRPLPTARLGIREGSHEGLTWRASTGRADAGGCASRALMGAGKARQLRPRRSPPRGSKRSNG